MFVKFNKLNTFRCAVGLLLFALSVAIQFLDLSEVLPFATKDSETVIGIAEGRISTAEANSYTATAKIYASMGPVLRFLLMELLALSFIWYILRHSKNAINTIILALLIFPATIFFLSQFNKDLILIPFIIASAFVMSKPVRFIYRVLIIFTIYITYAILFREYYYLIAFFFIAILLWRKIGIRLRIVVLPILVIALINTPPSVFQNLQQPRDDVNITRISKGADGGARTAFLNPSKPDSVPHFLENYVYAGYRLNLAILHELSPQTVILTILLGFYWWSFTRLFKSQASSDHLACTLFLSHVIVLTLFEPDLGSYLRHISSTLPFVAYGFSKKKIRILYYVTNVRKQQISLQRKNIGSIRKI